MAVDMLFSEDLLDRLNIPEWERLRSLDAVLPKARSTKWSPPVRMHYDILVRKVRDTVRQAIARTYQFDGADLWIVMNDISGEVLLGAGWQSKDTDCLTTDKVDGKRTFTVPKRELDSTQSFICVWKGLNQYQRALCPLFWQCIRDVDRAELERRFLEGGDVAADFVQSIASAHRMRQLLPSSSDFFLALNIPKYIGDLFQHVEDSLRAWAVPLVQRDSNDFVHCVTPHLLLTLDDNEMNFLRLADDETRFQADVPEADLGPVGPGPAFHTGQSVPSVSDLDLEHLAVISANDDASTVVGSAVAQDGISTVYDRRRVLARPSGPSVASEQFTDTDVSVDCAEARHAVPDEYRTRGQSPPGFGEQRGSDYGQDSSDGQDGSESAEFSDGVLNEEDEEYDDFEDGEGADEDDSGHLREEDDENYEVISKPVCP